MTDFAEVDDTRAIIKSKLRQHFDGKIVRKDLTKKKKKGRMSPFMSWSSFWDSIAALMIQRSLRKA